MDVAGKRMLVVGLGKSGVAACRLLVERGARVVANDQRGLDRLPSEVAALQALGVELALGGHDPALFTQVDAIIVSPGVPPLPALDAAEAAGVPIASEIELASWFIQGRIVGITGTNGKSTVTTLVGEMARLMTESSGKPSFVGGNLGTPLVDVVGTPAAGPDGLVVVELSSFQLERVDRLRVHVAVLLNLSEDHLDRYATYAEYAAAKARIFAGQRTDDACVVPSADRVCTALARASAAQLYGFGAGGVVDIVDGVLCDRESGLGVPVAELGLAGAHNRLNACAAALAARLAGVPTDDIARVLREFRGLPHRMQWVRELRGVRYYDDSKATNVGATLTALEGVAQDQQRVVLIAGGKHKGSPYTPLRPWLDACARGVVLLGEAAPLIQEALQSAAYPVQSAPTMQAAVEQAAALARPGDLVLLSPACSSFDMFSGYAARGQAFQAAVHALTEGAAWA